MAFIRGLSRFGKVGREAVPALGGRVARGQGLLAASQRLGIGAAPARQIGAPLGSGIKMGRAGFSHGGMGYIPAPGRGGRVATGASAAAAQRRMGMATRAYRQPAAPNRMWGPKQKMMAGAAGAAAIGVLASQNRSGSATDPGAHSMQSYRAPIM